VKLLFDDIYNKKNLNSNLNLKKPSFKSFNNNNSSINNSCDNNDILKDDKRFHLGI
jgi:hypothetical protein